MKQKLLVLITLFIIILSFFKLWWQQAIKPANPQDTEYRTFTIEKGESVKSIADRLFRLGLIRSKVALFLLSRFGGLSTRIQAGDTQLSPTMNLTAISEALTKATQDIKITIPEGWRNEEIAFILTKQLGIPESEFLKFAKIGYMFPDTYFIPKDSTSGAVAKILLDTFDQKVTQNIREKSQIKKLTLSDLITIASLVEREAKLNEDRRLVASVILNRLNLGMKLDIDATIQYALGYQSKEKSWWKKELSIEDVQMPSPFNTYQIAGLPPTPICNPGLASIHAVIDAPETDYLYYVADKNGKSHFAKTYEEHSRNISLYTL